MKLIFTLAIGAACTSLSFGESLFLEASDFNAFIRNNYTGANSDVQGRVATGGNFSVQNYSVGSLLSGFTGDSLVVEGKLNYTNGQVFYGNVTTADTAPSTSGLSILNGTLKSGTSSGIVIPELMTELVARSGYVGSLSANGTTDFSFGSLTFSGGTGSTRIYNVTASQLGSATSLTINAPAGTTAVVNVSGSTATFQNAGFSLTGGITSNKVLLNFWGAKSVALSGVGIQGSVFAPQADVSFSNGNMEGQLIADSFNGGGELHLSPFTGTVPVPEPSAIAALALGLTSFLLRRRKNITKS